AGLYLAVERAGRSVEPLPGTTALGSLARHLTESDPKHFQPANVNYGLFPELPEKVRKTDKRAGYTRRAALDLATWAERMRLPYAPVAPAPTEEAAVAAT
ncbi:MAG TPA: methylenetetrahydrofolate--tRNA-(uracil(54)-C(5))-methyltransferase (FADH(2)-oxidizing) TrmFO, partial [Thermoanaerobaculia bacterium]